MNLKRVFHKVFKESRLKSGYSQGGLSKKMGVCLTTVRRWDVGTAIPNVAQYFDLLGILGEDMHTVLVKKTLKKHSNKKDPNHVDGD